MVYLDEMTIRQLYDAFNRRDFETVLKLYADDIVLYAPGRNQISGTYHGRDEVLKFWNKHVELTGGTFHPQVLAVAETDEHVVVIADVNAERGGKSYSWRRILHFIFFDARAIECWIYEHDQYAADEAFA